MEKNIDKEVKDVTDVELDLLNFAEKFPDNDTHALILTSRINDNLAVTVKGDDETCARTVYAALI